MEIEKKLQTPVNYTCHNRPLNEVLNQLAKLVSVNIHIDEEGLQEEGLTHDLPVTLELNSDIMLKSTWTCCWRSTTSATSSSTRC